MGSVIGFLKEKLTKQYKDHSWNYRVVKRIYAPVNLGDGTVWPQEEIFGIAEVYYEKGEIANYATYGDGEEFLIDMYGEVKHQSPFGNSLEDLKGDLELMLKAFNSPVLDYEELVARANR